MGKAKDDMLAPCAFYSVCADGRCVCFVEGSLSDEVNQNLRGSVSPLYITGGAFPTSGTIFSALCGALLRLVSSTKLEGSPIWERPLRP